MRNDITAAAHLAYLAMNSIILLKYNTQAGTNRRRMVQQSRRDRRIVVLPQFLDEGIEICTNGSDLLDLRHGRVVFIYLGLERI